MFDRAGTSRQLSGRAPESQFPGRPYLIWLLSLLVCSLAAAVSFVYLDVPVARRVYGLLRYAEGLSTGLASAILVGVEASVALTLVVTRIVRGRLTPFRETTALACLASICVYAINESTLKPFFGVPDPARVFYGAGHAFHWLHGSPGSSFPSGHMVLAGAFAGVFMRFYRASITPLAALLIVGALLLIVGDWHFISDVIAGTFVGITGGLLAGEAWLAHSNRATR